MVDKYQRKVRKILGLELKSRTSDSREVYTLHFNDEAKDVMQRFVDEIEPMLAEGAELGDMTDWAGKLAGAVARIAGILHMLDHAGKMKPWDIKIGPAVVKRAIKVGEYLIPHAKYTLAYMGSDPIVEDAKYLLGHIERAGWRSSTKRDLFQEVKGKFDKVSRWSPVLDFL